MKKIPLVEDMASYSPLDKKEEHLFDGTQMEQSAYLPLDKEIPRQPVAISIGEHEYKGVLYPTAFGSYGDYSCIVGSSKSKKTFLKSAICAGYIGGKANFYFDNIRGHGSANKYVIDIDTEQSKFHAQRVFRRVEEMVGAEYSRYRGYSLREYSAKQRMEFIDWLLTRSELAGNIGLVLIDGLADLVSNFNDIEESNTLQENLLRWTTVANCHIIGVMHRNFGSDKPVGHVGSAVLKKAETVIFTNQEKGVSDVSVSCEYSRNLPFDNFKFTVDSDFLPMRIDEF